MDSQLNAIEVRNMSKIFKRVYDKPNTLKERLVFWQKAKTEVHTVLNDINIDIKKGETVALIGTNGSGKSTLLKLMTKILYPTEGIVRTNGKLTSLLELGAGFHPDFTGRENIYFNASIFGLTRKQIDSRVDDIINFSELHDFIDNPVRTYSSGMYMRLAFSIAINVDAEILLLDEILAVGDQHFQDKCFAKLEELRDGDKTIVIVSHSLGTIQKLCTRAIWIYNGDVMEDGNPEEIIEHYLERISDDQKDKAPLAIKSEKHKGTLFVDEPLEETQIVKKDTQKIYVRGWELSEFPESKVVIFLGNKLIAEAKRYEREDVINQYQNRFGGVDLNLKPGWEAYVDVSGLSLGKHTLTIRVLGEKEHYISESVLMIHVQ